MSEGGGQETSSEATPTLDCASALPPGSLGTSQQAQMQMPMMQMPMMQMPMMPMTMPMGDNTGTTQPMAFSFDMAQMRSMMQGLGNLPQGTGVVYEGDATATPIADTPKPPSSVSSPSPTQTTGASSSSRGPPPPVPVRQKSAVEQKPFVDTSPAPCEEDEDEDDIPEVEEFPEDIASDQVIKEGWLWKKASKLNRWQKRYVRLYSTYMTYYEKLPASPSVQPDGVFALEGYVVGKVNQGDAYIIQLKHGKGGRDYQFQANTPWEVELWVVELQEVMEALPDRMAASLPSARPKMSDAIAAQSLRLKSQAVKGGTRLTVRSKSKGAVLPRRNTNPVFCVPIATITQVDPSTDIPLVVMQAVDYLRPKTDIEGLFRLSGSSIAIAQLKDRYDSGEAVDLAAVQDPHAVAGLLKLFFREMPEPLLTFSLYEEFLAFPGLNESEQLETMTDLLGRLPERNLKVLSHVMLFLQSVAEKEAVNFMGTGNIAIVFGPNIMRRENATMIESMLESKSGNTVVKYMLDHVDELFK